MKKTDKIVTLAKEKSEEREKMVLDAIGHMQEDGRKITFYSVQKETGVSRSFLYNNEKINQTISKIRDGKNERPQTATLAIEDALKKRIHDLERENKELQREALYKEKYFNLKEENTLLKKRIEELLGKLY